MVQCKNKDKELSFLFSQIPNMFICFIFEHNIFAADKAIHNFQFFITKKSTEIKFMLSNQATTEMRGFIRGQTIIEREIMTLI